MTSDPSYNDKTTGTEVAERFQERIRGKNVLITGVSPLSLGENLAVTIATHEPSRLMLASRTISKLQAVYAKIPTNLQGRVSLITLDLNSQDAIRKAAAQISELVSHIDIVINNAAVVNSERRETVEGIEQQFGVNHVGHFLLVSLLLPKILASGHPRIVNVSSAGYRISPIRFHDYNFTGQPVPSDELSKGFPAEFYPDVPNGRNYHVFCAYGQCKTANILHAVGLNQRFGDKGLRAFAVHPGNILTDLSRNLTPETYKFIEASRKVSEKTGDQGIASILVAALDPALDQASNVVYFEDCQPVEALKFATDPEKAERLWKLSESLTGGESRL